MSNAQCPQRTYEKENLCALKEAVDIDQLLNSLNIHGIRETPRELRGPCPIHGGDNKSAFRFNKEKRTWQCFTNKCHEVHGGDVIGLIKASLGVDFMGALNHLKNLVGDVCGCAKTSAQKQFERERREFLHRYSKPKTPEYVSEKALKSFSFLRSDFFSKEKNGNFTPDVLDHFEVAGGYTDSMGIIRDVIPIRNVKGELVAYSLRDIRRKPPSDDFKYILTEGFIKDDVLYNLNHARLFGTSLPLIVVEGFKSVWKLYEYGIYNVVAVMGSAVLPGHANLLKAYALKGVAILFDPDKAGRLGSEAAKKVLQGKVQMSVVNMLEEDGEDPAELTFSKAYGYLNEFIR